VHDKKQQSLIDAAEAYCEAKGIDFEIRFDIIAIVHQGSNSITKHIEGAF